MPPQAKQAKAPAGSDSNMYAAIGYISTILIWIIGPIVLYLVKKDDKFVKFHSVQAILLEIVLLVVMIAVSIVGAIVAVFTFGIGLLLLMPVFILIGLVTLAITLFLAYKAYKGEAYKLPVIGAIAEKYS